MIGVDQARILVVDDQDDNVHLLERILGPTYPNTKGITSPGLALDAVAEFEPDLVLLDLHMPGTSGFDILEQLRQPGTVHALLPVVVLTADSTPEARNRALELGANDYLTKPLDRREVLLRVRNTLQVRMLHLDLQDQNRWLEDRVRERTRALEEANIDSLERLAMAAEFRDDDTGQHTRRVGDLAASIAENLGWDKGRVDMLRRAAPLHDVGKIAVPDAVLLKPARLDESEFEIIKTHCVTGGRLLHGSNSSLLQQAESIAISHHERWDGTGYPNQLCGEQIPIAGRVVAVADVFDSLTHERVYKRAWSRADACAEIGSQAGRQFDPVIVSAFVASAAIR
jgi:putative two-component system response regulator